MSLEQKDFDFDDYLKWKATFLKQIYSVLKGGDSPNEIKEVWYELASELTIRVIDPKHFIDAQFFSKAHLTRPPSPQSLLQRSAFDRYERYREDKYDQTVDDLRIRFNSKKSNADQQVLIHSKSGYCTEECVRLTLCYEGHDYCPLFSYLLAMSTGGKLATRARSRYLNEAILRYVPLQQEYDGAWGKNILDDLRTEAPVIYSEILSPYFQ